MRGAMHLSSSVVGALHRVTKSSRDMRERLRSMHVSSVRFSSWHHSSSRHLRERVRDHAGDAARGSATRTS
jgi:hypothetical protein